jgi:glycine/D-amino acid oxidase-like deaminating enzyme
MAPHLSDRLVGAVYCPAEGRIDPLRGCQALLRLSQRAGARVLRGAEVTGITREGNSWRVQTSRGDVLAGRIVNAAGPYSAAIAGMVGLDLPVGGTIQQVIVTEPAPRLVEHLVAYAHRHLSLKQQDSGGLLIGGGWYGGFDRATGRSRNLRRNIQGNLWVAGQVLPALRGLSIVRAWTGVALQVDRAPILGEAPHLPGFFNAVTATGYTLSPILGRMTADLLTHGEPIPEAFTLARFG